MSDCPKAVDWVTLFSSLSDRTRLRLLNLMAGREVCVCYFVEILHQGQPKISRHLAYLRRAGIVAARREGKWMHYSICPPPSEAAASILDTVLASLRTDEQMRLDLVQLELACCSPQKPILPQGAPKPAPIAASPQL